MVTSKTKNQWKLFKQLSLNNTSFDKNKVYKKDKPHILALF